ncbi:MAG TPA: T9SS type A sorting domain-containing protein, partial [Ignavibacteria bacterium]|nr:T9SS type A sorting domain-containing protein [Ignavibacteria bacterium]
AYFWQPDILWGGGTPLHVNDPNPLGAWKPKSMADFYTHDSTKRLVLLGHGCENHIEDTSNIHYNTEILRNLIYQLNSGALPATGFYPAFSIFNVGDLNSGRVIKISQFIDSVNSLTAGGRVQWNSLSEIYNIWNTSYNQRPYYVMCEDIPLAVEQIGTEIPNAYSLLQNYPNPFNPVTRINFTIPERTVALIKVYDVTGKLISELLNKELSAGTYSVSWDASSFSGGVYFYSLITSKFTQTKKMILVK